MFEKYFVIKIILILLLIASFLGLGFSMNIYNDNSLASDQVEDKGEESLSLLEKQEETSKSDLVLEVAETDLQEIAENSFFISPAPEEEVEEDPESEPRPQPSDRNQEGEEEKDSEVQELPNPFQLRAVSDHETEGRAIIYYSEAKQTYIIKPGDEVEGYKVTKITSDVVTMQKEGQQIQVKFKQ
ncbi:MAG: hypothetical protein ACOC5A_04815 [Halanaerobiales bacterium]